MKVFVSPGPGIPGRWPSEFRRRGLRPGSRPPDSDFLQRHLLRVPLTPRPPVNHFGPVSGAQEGGSSFSE